MTLTFWPNGRDVLPWGREGSSLASGILSGRDWEWRGDVPGKKEHLGDSRKWPLEGLKRARGRLQQFGKAHLPGVFGYVSGG